MKKLLFLVMLLTASPVFAAPLDLAGSARATPVNVAGSASATPVADTFSDPGMEARARNLQRQLRCLVCQGESIDESGSSLAAELRHQVRQQMADGRSDQQIEGYLTARYGNFILMKPPFEEDTYFLWLAPFLVLIGAAGVAMFVIGKARRAAAGLPQDQL
jgi:cytochrome c-type biogenesis protein CcmH